MPFGDGTVKAYLDTTSGALEFELGELDQPDAVMVTDYKTARSMIVDRDPAIAMQAFLAGRIQVQGDMMKLMALQEACLRARHPIRSPKSWRRSPTSADPA